MNELWLIEQSTLENIQVAFDKGINTPSIAELSDFDQSFVVDESGRPGNMQIVGDRALISITGVMTDSPDWFMKYYGPGNTTYSNIRTAIAVAESDPSVKEIVLDINSPGGQATPEWIATIESIESTTKPVHAKIGFIAASGAYGLAVKADTISAQNVMSHIGSIGVVQQVRKKNSGSVIEVTSSNAPNKRPDPETESGLSEIMQRIDDIETIFIGHVASGRGVSDQTVKNDFGQGGLMLAEKALKVGMIDEIAGSSASVVNNNKPVATVTGGEQTKEADHMDLAKLKVEHPGVYAQAVAAGEENGVAKERDRVSAFAIVGEASGDMKTAMAAIKDGSEMTATLQATFMAASMNRSDTKTRVAADVDASNALDNADTSTISEDMEDQIAKAMCEQNGIDWEGGK